MSMNIDKAAPSVDWAKPIEAVRKSDGRVVPMTFVWTDPESWNRYTEECPDPERINHGWKEDGSDCCHWNEWYIRNRVEGDISTPEHSPKTLRDEFAMAALAGLAAGHYPHQAAAVLAYEYADKMMEARK